MKLFVLCSDHEHFFVFCCLSVFLVVFLEWHPGNSFKENPRRAQTRIVNKNTKYVIVSTWTLTLTNDVKTQLLEKLRPQSSHS